MDISRALLARGPALLALAVALGLLLPPLAALAREAMTVWVFVYVTGTFLRVDLSALRGALRRPWLYLALPLLLMVALPLAALHGLLALGLTGGLAMAAAFALCAPPSSGNAAVARMLGSDATLPFAVTLVCTAAVPWLVPLVSQALGQVAFSPWDLSWRLAGLLGSAVLVSVLLRGLAPRQVARHATHIDLLVLWALAAFALGAMADVQRRLLADPLDVLQVIALACAMNAACQLLGAALARPGERLGTALVLGNRNVGLLWGAMGAGIDPRIALYFAAAQLPIHLSPWLLQRVLRRGNGPAGAPQAR